jgi:hypothetical protein
MREEKQRPRVRSAEGGTLRRRGLMAAMAGLAAATLAKATEPIARATDGSPLIVGQTNTSTVVTTLNRTAPSANLSACFSASTNTGRAVSGSVSTINNGDFGVYGSANGFADLGHSAGVMGTSNFAHGVIGSAFISQGQAINYGVLAQNIGAGIGLRADSGRASDSSTIGVLGVAGDPSSGALTPPNASAAVYGLSNGSATGVVGQSNNGVGCQGSSNGNVGVLGTSNASHALYGSSINGYGLYATSTNSTGIVASTNNGNAIQGASNGNVAVLGTSNSSIGGYFASGTATGLYATGPASGFAARFDGPVLVNGNFTAIGGSKSAAVPHPDGSYRRLYCVESPESWFEDFGRDQLTNGRARVRLDRDFAALVHGDNYEVFLTLKGECKGVYVSSQEPNSFEVRELQGGTSSVPFSYRVVAKRKDIAGPRLEKVDIPSTPQRPAPPEPPRAIPQLEQPTVDPNYRPPRHDVQANPPPTR